MDVQCILEKQQQKVSRFKIKAHAMRREEDPRYYEAVELEYLVTGENIRKEAVERAIRLSQDKYSASHG